MSTPGRVLDKHMGFVAPPKITIHLTEGPCAGLELHCAKCFNLTIGRTRKSKLHIKDQSVSEVHAQLSWSGASWILRDSGSTNGTAVNNKKLQPLVQWVQLSDGDEVVFGDESKGVVKMEQQTLEDLTVEQLLSCLIEATATGIELKGQEGAKQLIAEFGQGEAMLKERLKVATGQTTTGAAA